MAVNISGLRRNIKNVAHNYTDAQVKVREATSNDPWGPSSTMMSEIADLTYNVVAFSEIMQMIWKRLGDNGKNWRHVYKALVLLEYLIKTGSEKVAQQCKENIFAIQTLKDFQYLDDNKDQGINVREKAKALVALLKDDERLRNERVRALKAKERFAQSAAGIGSDTAYPHHARGGRFEPSLRVRSPSDDFDGRNLNAEMEAARPQTAGEEELQLELALAMSREEAEQEESKSKSDDMRLQLALQKSKEEEEAEKRRKKPSNDLLDLDFGNPVHQQVVPPLAQPPPPTRTAASLDPWGMPVTAAANSDPWGGLDAALPVQQKENHVVSDPWSPEPKTTLAGPLPGAVSVFGPSRSAAHEMAAAVSHNDPWTATKPSTLQDDGFSAMSARHQHQPSDPESMDLFSPQAQNALQEFDDLRDQIEMSDAENGRRNGESPNPFDAKSSGLDMAHSTGAKPKKTVNSLLGEHSKLVNLDNLVSGGSSTARNPFEQQPANPFQAKAAKPAMNDLRQNNAWPQQNAVQQQELNPFF